MIPPPPEDGYVTLAVSTFRSKGVRSFEEALNLILNWESVWFTGEEIFTELCKIPYLRLVGSQRGKIWFVQLLQILH